VFWGAYGATKGMGDGMKAEDNHKGQLCPYKNILCQEGYCSECQIYMDCVEKKYYDMAMRRINATKHNL